MKRENGSGPDGSDVRLLHDGQLVQRCPNLWGFITDSKWDDGQDRVTSTLLIFAEDGWLKGCLNDRDAGRSLWATSGTLAGLLDALEGDLAGRTGEWRVSGKSGGGKKR